MDNNLVQNINALKSLPENWDILDFEKVISDVSSGNTKIKKSNLLLLGKYPVIDQGKDLIAGYIDDENALIKTKGQHIIFGDHTRIFKFIDFPFVMGADGIKVLKLRDDNNFLKYIYYFFQTLNIPDTGYNRHFKYLKSVKIPLPPLTEQKRIAKLLDTADKLREQSKKIIEKYDELTQSLFLEMFGKGKYPKQKLGDFIELIGGGTPSKKIEEYWNGEIPWASVKDLKSNYLINTIDYITLSGVENSATKIIPKGSLIIATRMAVGKTAINKIDVAINQDLKAVNKIKEINIIFLQYLINSKKLHLEKVSSGATVKGIKIEHITELKVEIPPKSLQEEFAERVKLIEKQKNQAEQSLQKSEELFGALLQKCFR